MDVLHLFSDSVVLPGGWFPIANKVVDKLEPLHQMIQFDEHSNVLLRLVVHDVHVDLWLLVPLLLFFPLLRVGVPHLFNHAAELHHVHRSPCDLGTNHISLVSFSDEVLLDNTKEL
jgi:hypothetical protein